MAVFPSLFEPLRPDTPDEVVQAVRQAETAWQHLQPDQVFALTGMLLQELIDRGHVDRAVLVAQGARLVMTPAGHRLLALDPDGDTPARVA